jgi:hypothetical protein
MKFIIFLILAGFVFAAWSDYVETKTMGVGLHKIQRAKAECEAQGKECVMLWDFVAVEADYE